MIKYVIGLTFALAFGAVALAEEPDETFEVCTRQIRKDCCVEEMFCDDSECYDPYPGHYENWCPSYALRQMPCYGAKEHDEFVDATEESPVGSRNFELKEDEVDCGHFRFCKPDCQWATYIQSYICVVEPYGCPGPGCETLIKGDYYQGLDSCFYDPPDYED